MTVIAKAPGAIGDVIIDGQNASRVFGVTDAGNLLIDGITIRNGSNGLYLQTNSQSAQGGITAGYSYTDPNSISPFDNVIVKNCKIYNINGTHGMAYYASNYWAPVTNFIFDNNLVYFSRCHSSEAVVLNGNIDGFVVSNNYVNNNNNMSLIYLVLFLITSFFR
jgi:hypothetical protein